MGVGRCEEDVSRIERTKEVITLQTSLVWRVGECGYRRKSCGPLVCPGLNNIPPFLKHNMKDS